LKRNITWARLAGGVLRQAGKAALAESIAAWMVARLASGDLADSLAGGRVEDIGGAPPLVTSSPLIRC
jgi:hypothetical protein